jgi:Fe-S-cluster containining protein
MSLCDTCCKPGHCCQNIPLWGNEMDLDIPMSNTKWKKRIHKILDRMDRDARLYTEQFGKKHGNHGVSCFIPAHLHYSITIAGVQQGKPRFKCLNLLDGRCSDYENRPELCKTYKEGSDSLCAEYCGPPFLYPNGTP